MLNSVKPYCCSAQTAQKVSFKDSELIEPPKFQYSSHLFRQEIESKIDKTPADKAIETINDILKHLNLSCSANELPEKTAM